MRLHESCTRRVSSKGAACSATTSCAWSPCPTIRAPRSLPCARHKLSQAVFASVPNTSLSTVRQWEIGDKRPSGPSLRLLSLLDEKGLEVLI